MVNGKNYQLHAARYKLQAKAESKYRLCVKRQTTNLKSAISYFLLPISYLCVVVIRHIALTILQYLSIPDRQQNSVQSYRMVQDSAG
jgi:hypothetical protein